MLLLVATGMGTASSGWLGSVLLPCLPSVSLREHSLSPLTVNKLPVVFLLLKTLVKCTLLLIQEARLSLAAAALCRQALAGGHRGSAQCHGGQGTGQGRACPTQAQGGWNGRGFGVTQTCVRPVG